MLAIENHRLVGDRVTYRVTPNVGGALNARYVVFHYTAGSSAESSVTSLCTRKPSGNASAHLVLARDGSIVQLAPFNVVTWHAGVSQWNGLVGMNNWSIGIEMDNAGSMRQIGNKFVAWFGRAYPDREVMLAEHKHGGGVRPWHAYTEEQIGRALELAELLVAHYRLEDVLGHEDIARGRKQDPGPAFPLSAIRARVLGREEDAPERYVVTASALNIRKGPDATFDTVAPPLKKGTVVAMLEAADRWSKVEVEGQTDVEGWVSNAYIVKASEATRKRGRSAERRSAVTQPRVATRAPVRRAAKRAVTKRKGSSKRGTTGTRKARARGK